MFFRKKSLVEKVVTIAALGLLSGILLSWPLWNEAARVFFPTLPVWGEAVEPLSNWEKAVEPLNGWPGWVRLAGLVILLICTSIFPNRKLFLILLIAWLIGLCAIDLNRLQPWVWFYLLVFAVVFFGKKENEISTANALRWLLAAVYFWGGFSKLTPYFAEDNFAWFCKAFAFTQPFGQFPLLGYAVAFFEMTFAAGLLWEKTRRHFKWLVIGFHAVIVIFLLKLDWNWVVIPWNVAMAAMVWTLAENSEQKPMVLAERVLVAFIWLTPALFFFQLWPQNLSWQLYSNTQPELTFYREKSPMFATIQEEQIWEKYAFEDDSELLLLLDDWAMDELKVPMFASERSFHQIGKHLIKHCNNGNGLYILTVNRWDKSAEKMEKIPCRTLLAK